ncbi:hypothetical protein [Cyclobacterium sp.]|jgi:hypothetical protein|uniref:hypothetical protein n=1 Tax=Cyclobacterium sp. TaxID=1966343 RepID=UPI0019CDF712|nr:hypothetical protein [Cyclobacterium sp.]MBD3629837.1 hypothetical protein [Cyclobacterium sp.]
MGKVKKIQEEVRNNGFSAKNAEVTIVGQLVKNENAWQVNVNGETFIVSSDTPSEIVKSLNTGKIKLKVFGKDKEDNHLNGTWDIRIVEVLKS